MKKGINLTYPNEDSPSTGVLWRNTNKKDRIKLLHESIYLFAPEIDITVIDAHDNGQVSIVIKSEIRINDRGTFLLDLEENLKSTIDIGINLWHEAIGDKSSLRNLRGIEVLS